MRRFPEWLLAGVLLLMWAPLQAQHGVWTAGATVTFPVGKADIRPTYMQNQAQLRRLDTLVNAFRMNIDSVSVVAFASPEGRFERNVELSQLRAQAMTAYLHKTYQDVQFGHIQEFAGGPDYQGLSAQILEDEKLPYREEVLDLVQNWGGHPEKAFQKLTALRGGVPYKYIYKKHLPWLRNATTIFIHFNKSVSIYEEPEQGGAPMQEPVAVEQARDTVAQVERITNVPVTRMEETTVAIKDTPVKTTVAQPEQPKEGRSILFPTSVTKRQVMPPTATSDATFIAPPVPVESEWNPDDEQEEWQPAPKRERRREREARPKRERREKPVKEKKPQESIGWPVVGIYTNVLFDAVTAANIGLHFTVSPHWDIEAQYIFPWWKNRDRKFALQVQHLNLGARYYFRTQDPLSGWFVSAGIGGGIYDIAPWGNGVQGWEAQVSLGGGYSWRLGKNWRLEASAAVGPVYTAYDTYEHEAGGIFKTTSARRILASPTNLQLSVIYLIPLGKR